MKKILHPTVNISIFIRLLSNRSPPPQIVPTGGLLLAGYLTMNAPPELFKKWRRYHRYWKNGQTESMTAAEFTPWLQVIASRFHGYMITAQCLYNAQNKQRFYLTFVARYHGLSQMGSDLMSSLGWLIPSTTYDRGVARMVEEANDTIRSNSKHVEIEHPDLCYMLAQ